MPSKPVLIRIVIYGSLIGFFGWRAYVRFSAQSEAEQVQEAADAAKTPKATRTMKLGDGTEMPVMELTREEAQAQFGVNLDDPPPPRDTPSMPDMGTHEVAPDPEINPRLAPPSGGLR